MQRSTVFVNYFLPGFLGGILFGSFDGVILTDGNGEVIHNNFHDILFSKTSSGFIHYSELEVFLFTLGPFYDFTLKIYFLVYQLINIEIVTYYSLEYNFSGEFIAFVKVQGPYQGFKRIRDY